MKSQITCDLENNSKTSNSKQYGDDWKFHETLASLDHTNNLAFHSCITVLLQRSAIEEALAGIVLEIKAAGDNELNDAITAVNGKAEGVSKGWHQNGQLSSEATFVNDKVEGVAKYWYENGQLLSKTCYKECEKTEISY